MSRREAALGLCTLLGAGALAQPASAEVLSPSFLADTRELAGCMEQYMTLVRASQSELCTSLIAHGLLTSAPAGRVRQGAHSTRSAL